MSLSIRHEAHGEFTNVTIKGQEGDMLSSKIPRASNFGGFEFSLYAIGAQVAIAC